MNWGKGITIFMILFIGFIGSMVYSAFTKNADLVDDDYYEKELAFDETKSEKQNFTASGGEIFIEKNEMGVTFLFPAMMKNYTEGTIEFYRPDQKKYDRSFDLEITKEQIQQFEYDHFVEGYYDVSVRWKDANDKGYIFESNISF